MEFLFLKWPRWRLNSFSLTNDFSQPKLCRMDKLIRDIQNYYPQIYLACHVEHRVRRDSSNEITDREGAVLAHLDASEGVGARELAKHLGIGAPALSATLKRLQQLGLIYVKISKSDARKREILLTGKGKDSMSTSSVLDARRLKDVLAKLTKDERRLAVEGMALLARAAKSMRLENERLENRDCFSVA
jgi:DNA-binding MarR family transcriptional regulator